MSIVSPSYTGLRPASASSSAAKRANKRSDTKHELLLRKTLWQMGLRYRKQFRALPGVPDIAFLAARVAVFCDGDFWHGRDWTTLSEKLQDGTNAPYWLAKIKSNMERDLRITALLEDQGWVVLRFWETDIITKPMEIAEQVQQVVKTRLYQEPSSLNSPIAPNEES
jgi:DNA mismatch endonuclease (patch repair protein)